MNEALFSPEALERIKARQSRIARKRWRRGILKGRPKVITHILYPEPRAEPIVVAVLPEDPKPISRVGRPRKIQPVVVTPRVSPRPELNGIMADFGDRRKPSWWAQLVEDARRCPPRLA
jgi:hypothetical protein